MEKTIDIGEIFHLFLSKWYILFASALFFGAFMFSYSFFLIEPVYVASGTLYVSGDRTSSKTAVAQSVNLSDLMLAQELTKSYSAILTSNTFFKDVARQCGLGYTYKEIQHMVSISKIEETEVMRINASNTDPKDAQILVNVVLELAPSEIERIIQGGTAKIIDAAELPESPASPNILKNTAIGIILGLALSGGIIFMKDMFDTRIYSVEELKGIMDLPVLGIVPDADKKSGLW